MHSKLDEFLCDEELVEERRREQMAKPNKVNIGNECPVCDQAISKQHSRVHVIWHFMEELRGIVQSFNNPTVKSDMRLSTHSLDILAYKERNARFLYTLFNRLFHFTPHL